MLIKMEENKLVSLDEILLIEKSIAEVANSGDINKTISLCDKLKGTAKENVKIAHIIRNQKYSSISQRLQYLQEQVQYLPGEEVKRIYQEVETLRQAEDIEFHNYLNFLQEDLLEFTRVIIERARLKYHLKRYPSK